MVVVVLLERVRFSQPTSSCPVDPKVELRQIRCRQPDGQIYGLELTSEDRMYMYVAVNTGGCVRASQPPLTCATQSSVAWMLLDMTFQPAQPRRIRVEIKSLKLVLDYYMYVRFLSAQSWCQVRLLE